MPNLRDLLYKSSSWSDQDLHDVLDAAKTGSYAQQSFGNNPLEFGLSARLLLEQIRAVKRFDEASRKLTKWLIWLTIVLVVLTVVIAGFTILLWMRG